ncbi:hypothetical protein [Roseateles koreensis]|uniref:Uncharacterized protein n=1 Tax=Roseateles koreensis TaxID=2987526 RepID=A0ABT5KR93_9BURK|nr:hypothetical protein [Roseateles koreensis]MDC8784898.1 hypothetical protein [Roseateles koreensis]
MTSEQYYVKAISVGGFAQCSYFILNEDGSYTQVKSPLQVSPTSTACNFLQHPDSVLLLQAAVFKTLPVSTNFASYNYAPISNGSVAVSMPDNRTVTKGVVLTFSNPDGTQLFSSSDPEVKNDDT